MTSTEHHQTSAWFRRFVPWQGPATRVDLALMGAILGVVGLGLVIRPFKPFLLADHPVLLEFATGDLVADRGRRGVRSHRRGPTLAGRRGWGCRYGEVRLAGLGAGRQWGAGIIRIFTTSERVQRYATRATERSPWIVRLAVVIAVLPGVPTAVVYAAAGWARMRLATFLLLDFVGALLMTAVIAGLGYSLGQRAVGRCCVGEEEADSSLWRHGSDDEGKFGEDRLKPAAGLSIVSEFVVAAA
jgi:hypothetical protein